MNRLWMFLPLALFVLIAGFFFVVQLQIKEGEYDPKGLPSALLNRPLPEFALPDLLSDTTIAREQLLGREALINVWATWCPSCHVEHPFLNRLAQRGVIIYGLDYKDNDAKARQWLQEKGNPYHRTLVDADGRVGLDLGVTGAPETYVIDHRGFVRLRHQGPLNEEVWQRKFAPLMAQLAAEREEDQG